MKLLSFPLGSFYLGGFFASSVFVQEDVGLFKLPLGGCTIGQISFSVPGIGRSSFGSRQDWSDSLQGQVKLFFSFGKPSFRRVFASSDFLLGGCGVVGLPLGGCTSG